MFGKNKILKPENSDGKTLKIHSIFDTFQGEGPFVGFSATFIRLAGCNLACDFCDTEFDEFEEAFLDEILARIKKSNQEMAVITGGEPLRQNIVPLCQELVKLNILTQIETNGTIFRPLPPEIQVICSPKTSQGRYFPLRDDVLGQIDALKFIISAHQKPYSNIAEIGQEKHQIPVYLQPMDEYDEAKNAANRKLTLELAQKYRARVSLQMHKILEIAWLASLLKQLDLF